jgi:hypothetical protein
MFNQIFSLLERAKVPHQKFVRQHFHEYKLARFKLDKTANYEEVVYQLLLSSLYPTAIILNGWLKKLNYSDAKTLFSIMLKKGLAILARL